jgi:uncharacterized membrane protein YedE/YeeE
MLRLGLYGFCGLVFGTGLAISGMMNPEKVLNFLDIGGEWDPSLAFVMASALGVNSIAWRLTAKRERPVLEAEFLLPSRGVIDRRLVVGAALFGMGWGLVGLCPGPALANMGQAGVSLYLFVASMVAGILLYRWVEDAVRPS